MTLEAIVVRRISCRKHAVSKHELAKAEAQGHSFQELGPSLPRLVD